MASSADNALSPRAREIVDLALELLEEEGPGGLSMRRLAERVGIRAPSIYKHLPDKQALEAAIISAGFELQADAFERALEDAEDPLGALAHTYRQFAKAHPHLYRLMTERELQREMLKPGVEDRAGGPVYEAVGRDADLARAAWAFAHGMTILELNRRFPPEADLDAAWERGLDAFRPAAGNLTPPAPRVSSGDSELGDLRDRKYE
jgi:AcrR family transcriptional regulator